MDQMPYPQAGHEALVPSLPGGTTEASADWRTGLPTLTGSRIVLREMRLSDAQSLFVALTTEDVARFISPPPATVDGFERFIAWTLRQRATGQYICFAVVPHGSETAIGLFQVRSLDLDFATAEWGFALASEFWGTGAFVDGARIVIDFAFEVLGAHRLEARAAVANVRGNSALHKMGAVPEGILRRSFLRRGEYLDQMLWAIVSEDWREAKAGVGSRTIH
jgi:[ribosomal protein S5]-alanine N-acetyltransferase